jgi:hypothetical protein
VAARSTGPTSQQAFLEGHELAFRHFGGVFRLLRYDNLTSAVRKVLRGRLREETERFIALRSHWHFEFCTPGAGHEKGGVEGENGYFRRNHWVPVPKAANLEVLNDLLLMKCREDERRLIDGRTQRVGQAMAVERDHLLALPAEGFDLAEISFPIVDGGGCVRTNTYSTPVHPGIAVQVKVYPAHLEVWHDGRCVTNDAIHGASRSWTLSRCARAQTRRLGGIHGAGAMAAGGTRQLRCAVATAD